MKTSVLLMCLLLFTRAAYSQDSLYLVGTIEGESIANAIINIKGVGDINGDGYDDFMVAKKDTTIRLYYGSADMNLDEDLVLRPNSTMKKVSQFGGGITSIGDIDNDGFIDMAVSAVFNDYGYQKGIVFIYHGGYVFDTIPSNEFWEPWIEDDFGYNTVSPLGDLNKDGYDDFAIGSPYNWTNGKGYVYIFQGGESISFNKNNPITSPNNSIIDLFGTSTANIGDINNDVNEEIAIGAPAFFLGRDTGKVYIYSINNEFDVTEDTILSDGIKGLGRIIKNAEGKNDKIEFLVSDFETIHIYDNNCYETFSLPAYSFDAGGDIDGDGYSDLVLGDDLKIKVFFGILKEEPNVIIDDSLRYSTGYICIPGDINNDGCDEVMSLSPNWPSVNSPKGKIFIYSYKKITNVSNNNISLPVSLNLLQNYPNPFNPNTTITYQLSQQNNITIKIFDVLGKEVCTLINEEKPAGDYSFNFNAEQYGLGSGIYFCELKINGGQSKRIKMLLLK